MTDVGGFCSCLVEVLSCQNGGGGDSAVRSICPAFVDGVVVVVLFTLLPFGQIWRM